MHPKTFAKSSPILLTQTAFWTKLVSFLINEDGRKSLEHDFKIEKIEEYIGKGKEGIFNLYKSVYAK
jgi:hypothetical protein